MLEGTIPQRSLSAQTLLNMGVAALSGIGAQLVVLAVTPVLLWTIGPERYGLWALCSSISRYGMLTDVLFAPIITNVAAASRTNDLDRIRKIATFATLFYLALFATFVPLARVVGDWLPRAFHLSPDVARDAPLFFTGYVAYFFGSIAATGLASVLNGLGLLRKSSAVNAAGTLLFATAAVVLALRGFGIWALFDGLALQLGFSAIAYYALCRRRLGRVFIAPRRIERALAVHLLTFGGWVQLSTLATLLGGETDQILIGVFVGVPAVGLYEVGSKLARAIRSLASYPNNALMPSIASLASDPQPVRIAAIVARASRLVSVVTIFVAAVLVGGSGPIVSVWLGNVGGAAVAAGVLVALAVNNLLETIVSIPVTSMRALGRPKFEAFATGAGAAINVVLTLSLVRAFGVGGVLAGTLAGTFAAFAIFYTLFARANGIALRGALFTWLLPLVVAGIVCAATLHAVLGVVNPAGWVGAAGFVRKVSDIVRLGAATAVAAGIYALIVRALHVFAPGELRATIASKRARV